MLLDYTMAPDITSGPNENVDYSNSDIEIIMAGKAKFNF